MAANKKAAAKKSVGKKEGAKAVGRDEAAQGVGNEDAASGTSAGVPVIGVGASAGGAGFPVVGIGASAGGLEALEVFLRHVPPDSGAAFVIIQHLDPDRQGMMPELLRRFTSMPVVQAGDRMRVEPNAVYVIPPNKFLSIVDSSLSLREPSVPRGLRLPIDFFFRALADERGDHAIGVILSGMGSDGTLGLRAIKERAGLALVQDPANAKYDGMPRSAIDAGLADIVAPADELPGRIAGYIKHVPPQSPQDRARVLGDLEAPRSAMEKIFLLLRSHTGHDFSLYKKSTVHRRIERRMGIHQIDYIADYVDHLHANPQEVGLLFKELLIGVTSFFRDPDAWAVFKDKALAPLLASYPAGKAMRAWVPGCSTGEEPYSIAMAFKETIEELKPHGRFSLQIFATDLDPDAIERARQAFYPANIAADIAPERLSRFFVEEANGYRVCKEIREMVVFAPQNVIMDPPFTKLDILSCRNVLIYLGAELQKRLLPLFHYSLNPGGILFLGSAETIGSFTDLFAPIEGKARLFRRSDVLPPAVEFPSRLYPVPHPAPAEPAKDRPGVINLQQLVEQTMLQQFAPAAVLVNSDGDILYVSGRTGRYLEPAAGKANWNIHAMARNGLREEVALALPKAMRTRERVNCRNLPLGDNLVIDLTVLPVDEAHIGVMLALIVFAKIPALATDVGGTGTRRAGRRSTRVAELERALQQAREETQAIREEMQTSREELKSTNEELQSTNEELQSTNEELTTSKEEMQSLNEELQTVNIELQSKVDELSAANNDMKNLLNSTDLATVFLDNALNIRRFTTQATRIFKLIPTDVGRPLTDIVTDLLYPELRQDALEVLRSLVFCEKQIATGDGRWYMVKIMPYRTLENVIDGVVITFTDINVIKRLESELRQGKDETN